MWDWQMFPRLSMTNAARYDFLMLGIKGGLDDFTGDTSGDFNNRSVAATSFNSGLVYHATDVDVIRALVSRGFQLPSLDVLGMQEADFSLRGDPHVQATQVTNYELDYDRSVELLASTVRTAVFHQTNRDLFNFLIVEAPSGLVSTNTGGSNENGVELSLKSNPATPFRWNLGYSYANITDHYKTIPGGVVLAEPFSVYKDGTPLHTINAGIGYTWEPWEFDIRGGWRSHYQDWQFSSETYAYTPVTTKSYALADLHVGYNLTQHVTLGLTVDQLTQAYTYERASSDPLERRVFGTLTIHY
jgi:iron complex outermembrane receptor protein